MKCLRVLFAFGISIYAGYTAPIQSEMQRWNRLMHIIHGSWVVTSKSLQDNNYVNRKKYFSAINKRNDRVLS